MASFKSLTVRLPEELIDRLAAESRARGMSRSDVVRERLEMDTAWTPPASTLEAITDVIGAVDGLPADMSARKKPYLRASGYGRKRSR